MARRYENKWGYRGVCKLGNCSLFYGRLYVKGRQFLTKGYDTPAEAAVAWQELALKSHDELISPPKEEQPPPRLDFVDHPRFVRIGMELQAMLDDPVLERTQKADDSCALPSCDVKHNHAVSRTARSNGATATTWRVIWYCCMRHLEEHTRVGGA